MAPPDWFEDLPAWATVVVVLLGLLAVMTAASMALGIVFAAIAIGVETGSVIAGLLAGTLGLAVFAVPLLVVAWWVMGDDVDHPVDDEGDTVDELRSQYLDGEINEATFERRLESFLDDGAELEFDRSEETEFDADPSPLNEPEREHER
ncbi:hypothetical protein [Natranaeroarchaeum sulfidigenes]|uniref:Putative membrane protein n=1 Tax=Natranaeroarchaeum sulfidigenes TaxID=2784880 RepID=A0A897MQ09_9EURY|nr:hypothetical protein [Natranaeroarchaeum sulfidigenes]QSG02674.1 putative membrane protein [Natranaeroarchaeum sulfidigenes]